ncbi:MAG: YraN family protein [Proteobacteria bacterium]|nr:YraN family protein [Pseudomonadota bacterium]
MPRDTVSRKKAYARGHKGEGLAALYLRLKGYRILERRYQTPVGEVDLIARRGRTLAFVEVKARKNYTDGVEAITRRQQLRTIKAAEYFLSSHPGMASLDLRFDAIIALPGFQLRHIPGAWQT